MTPSRNSPCPCGSGNRYKRCCGVLADIPARTSPDEAAIDRDPTAPPALSLVLPFYRKLEEFRRVLPLNLRFLQRAGLEVVVVMDESSEEAELLALLRRYPGVRWKVIVNDRPHDWRPPCKAINVGIRHAAGRYVFVASPESAFLGDVLSWALDVVKDFPRGIAIGRVGFARFEELARGGSLLQHFDAGVSNIQHLNTYYGSLCAPREALEAVTGYDEGLTGWGGDDDNLRVRLEMAGYTLLACPLLRLLHLAFEPRHDGRHPAFAYDFEQDCIKCAASAVEANPTDGWGRDFARIAYASVPSGLLRGRSAAALSTAPKDFRPAPGTVIPTGSRRRCRECGRLLHYESPARYCPACSPPSHGVAASFPTVSTGPGRRPTIACVMQLRNEAAYLAGCLAHLRDHVDGFIALDDGSSDDTSVILRREPRLLGHLANPAQPHHVWCERENRRRLLQLARQLGVEWVLCCDADERFESALLASLPSITASFAPTDVVYLSVRVRELWDDPRQYRVDGLWGKKSKACLFRVPPRIEYVLDQDLHGQWYPDHIRKYGRLVALDSNLYHLKMIFREGRAQRRDLYKALDPDNRFQSIGYDYLADEGDDLRLEPIPVGRGYDLTTLPDALQALL